jgi:putative dehydrogenase
VKIGVVGLGVMGGAMAARMLSHGFEVTGFDPDPQRCPELEAAGGSVAPSPAAVAQASETVVLSLPSEDAFEDVTMCPEGLAAGVSGQIPVIDTSTLPIALKEKAAGVLLDAGAVLLDCPVSGTGDQARTGDLVVLASGDEEVVNRCAPVFEGFARAWHYVGDFGSGSKMKFVANLLVAIHNVAAAEGLMLAQASGLDPDQTLEVIADSAATSRMWEVRGPKMVTGEYEPGIRLNLFDKDLRLISSFARHQGSPAPLLAEAVRLYEQALAAGDGELDSAVVFRRYQAEGGGDS